MGVRLVYGLKTEDEAYLNEFYPSRRLAEAAAAFAAGRGEARPLDYGAMLFHPGAEPGRIVRACEGHIALLRGELPDTLYRELEAAGVRVVNPAAAHALAKDKLRSAEFFADHGIEHPRTVAVPGPSGGAGFPEPPLPYPFVAKPRFGKMGKGVALVSDPGAWLEWLRASPDGGIAQVLVPGSAGRDLRFFFARWRAGGETHAGGIPPVSPVCVTREGGDFLSNAHAGARMRPYSPPPALAALAASIFSLSGLDYGTVDFLFADAAGTAFTVCELNSCPGFEELERATGLDAAAAIIATAAALA